MTVTLAVISGEYGYVFGGYGAVAVIVGGYAVRVRRRARALARTLPPDTPAGRR